MDIIYRLHLNFKNCNPLAGYFTNGPSLAAAWGMFKNLESLLLLEKAADYLRITKFCMIQGVVKDKTNQHIKKDMDFSKRFSGDKLYTPSMDSGRHADFEMIFYFQISTSFEDTYLLGKQVAKALNSIRFQGGTFEELIGYEEDPKGDVPFREIHASNGFMSEEFSAESFLQAISSYEKKYNSLFNIVSKVRNMSNTSVFVEDFLKESLTENRLPYTLICNGYTPVPLTKVSAEKLKSYDPDLNLVEPSFALVQLIPLYSIVKKENFNLDDVFWSNDHHSSETLLT